MNEGNNNLESSDGCNLKNIKLIQRCAPIPILPLIRVKIKRKIVTKQPK